MPIELRPWAQKLKDRVTVSRRHKNEESDSGEEKKLPPLPGKERQSEGDEKPGPSDRGRKISVSNRRHSSGRRRRSGRHRKEPLHSADATPAVPQVPEKYRNQEPASENPFSPRRLFGGSLSVLRKTVTPSKDREARRRADSRDEGKERQWKDGDRTGIYRRKNAGKLWEDRERMENLKAREFAKQQKQQDPVAEARLKRLEEIVNRGQAMKDEERRMEAKLKEDRHKREAERQRDEEKKAPAKAQHRKPPQSVPERESYRAPPELNMENLSEYDKLFLDDGPEESVLGRGIGNMNRTVLEGFARVPEKYWKIRKEE